MIKYFGWLLTVVLLTFSLLNKPLSFLGYLAPGEVKTYLPFAVAFYIYSSFKKLFLTSLYANSSKGANVVSTAQHSKYSQRS